MRLLPRSIFFSLIIFYCCICLCRATNCGGSQVVGTITVDQQGKGEFKTIQAAINSIKINNDQWFKIHINSGIYAEEIYNPAEKPCVILEGYDRKTTIITASYPERPPSWNPTFSSYPPNVVVSGITFENSYNLKGWSKFQNLNKDIKPSVAAAFYVDKSAIFNCSFFSYQDTLFAATGRHYFKDCYIQGEVDFIFGSGQSYFESCTINATPKKSRPPGFVAAQYRDSPNKPGGFIFRQGFVIGNGQVNLGRAYGPYSRVIYWGTYFSSVVTPKGWDAWNYAKNVSDITFVEVDCRGLGAKNKSRVAWMKKGLTNSKLDQYSLSSFINSDKWLDNLPPTCL